MAATVSPGPRHLHPCVPRRYCSVAPGSRHPLCTNATGDVFSAGDGVPAQSGKVPPLPVFVSGVALCSLASAVWSLASPGRAPVQYSGHGPYLASGPHSHPPPTRTVGGAHKFRLSGASVSPPVPTTSYTQLHLCQGRREGPSESAPPFYAGRSAVLDVSNTLGPHLSVPCRSPTSFSVDGCVLFRVGALLELSLVGSGLRSSAERHLHVNDLKLRAIRRAASFFHLRDLSLRVFTDNETVSYTLVLCRTRSPTLRRELVDLLEECQSRTCGSRFNGYPRPSTSWRMR